MNSEQMKVKCIGMDEDGKGIVKINDYNIHVPYLIEGETATIEVSQKRNYIDAKVIEIEEKSENRVQAKCQYFESCGGCQLQHMKDSSQAEFKQSKVEKLMKHYGKVNKILTMKVPYFYRNKVHAVISSDKKGKIISGIYEENTHHVVPVDKCMIEDSRSDKIIKSIVEIMKSCKIQPYDEDTGYGFIRHILIRRGFATNQIMVVLVVSSNVFQGKNNFMSALLKAHPEITTVVMNVNNKKTSAVLGTEEKVLFGKGYIEDTLCKCVFQISSKSFYQINPVQTEVLYNKAIEMADLKGSEVVLDAYCGIGTISLIASKKAKNVIGVELNKDAVKDAIKNARRNKISNVYFYNDDAGNFMVSMARERQKVDTVFMDPPRSGSDEKFLSSLVRLAPKQVIYISCNPETQERDLKFLTHNGYMVKKIQPVDMFPQTKHVECIVRIEKK